MPGGRSGGRGALGERSTAVLPFVNMSSDKDNEYFSDGLTENLLHKLAQVNDLKVAARTSSFAFKGKQEDVRAIGKALGVATLVEGSVAARRRHVAHHGAAGPHHGRQPRLVAALRSQARPTCSRSRTRSPARSPRRWSARWYPRPRRRSRSGGTANLSAYDDYTRGLQQLAHFNFESLTQAERLFQQALVPTRSMSTRCWPWSGPGSGCRTPA